VSQIPLLLAEIGDDDVLSFDPSQRELRRRHLSSLRRQRVTVEIKPWKSQRSLDQNAWIWGVAYPVIAEAIGYERHEHDELHYALVAKCFGEHFDKRIGAMVPNKRSSKLSTKEFSEYMTWLVRFAAKDLGGIYVPLPDEAAA
jgi:hypothetical protein